MRLLWQGSGYSARELADLSGVSHGTISNWANDKGQASLDEVKQLADVFGWTLEELYYGKGDENTLRRLAELEAFRRRAERFARDLLGIEQAETSGTSAIVEASTLTARSSAPPSAQHDEPEQDRRDHAANE